MTESAQVRWVGVNEARAPWAEAAVEVLTAVASHYHAVITYDALAEQIQSRTGLRTRSQPRNWIGSVLGQVVASCRSAGLPPLTSLVAHRPDGGLDLDESTISARLACYRRYADDVPADVIAQADARAQAERLAAEEQVRQQVDKPKQQRARRTVSRTPPRPEPAPAICPTCFMQLPASGVCDTCG